MASHCMDEEAPGSGAKPAGRVGEGASPTLPPLSLKTRYGYASGAIANGVKNVSFSAYLMFFYNQVVGVPAAIVSAALAATLLLDALIAESYERIHRSNLVGMGVLPLQFAKGENADALGLDGSESFSIAIDESLQPRQDVPVVATKRDGSEVSFKTVCRIDTPVEVEYYRNGGILHTVLRRMAYSS